MSAQPTMSPAPGTVGSDHRPPVQSARAVWTVRIIGIAAAVGVALTVWLGLWVTPPDQVQGNLVRLVYLHPAVAWVALYLAFGLAAAASLLYLWPRTRSMFWDRLAAAAVEVGVVFNVCTLISGSIWGRPTWGVYWAWDARLTLTAVLLVLFLGYMALRRVPAEPEKRAKRSAIVALFAAVDVPLDHFSVLWWRTLHQGATVLNPDLSPTIHGSMAWTLLISFLSLTLAFVWMLLVRYRIGVLQDWLGRGELDVALLERQAEGSPAGPVAVGPVADPEPAGAGLLAVDEEPDPVTAPDHTAVPGGVR
jgi:heme exporter protein C